MKNLITFCSIIIVLFSTSCKKERLTANGDLRTETRTLTEFDGVQNGGSTPIRIVYGSEFKAEVSGSSNLLPHFKTKVINKKLYLNYEDVNIRRSDVSVVVTLPIINNIALSGSSNMDLQGNFPYTEFLNIDLSGSGKLSINQPLSVGKATITISGSGEVNAGNLTAVEASVDISGSGDARLKVVDKLAATVSGSGKIYYSGSPVIESRISGSGRVIKY